MRFFGNLYRPNVPYGLCPVHGFNAIERPSIDALPNPRMKRIFLRISL